MNIVVTGASRGVGYYTAIALEKIKGNKIFALSRDEKGLNKLFTEAGKDSGIKIIPCDISDEKSLSAAISAIEKEVSSVELLINNAGALINKKFQDLSIAEWRKIYEVNVFGVVNITRLLLPLLKKGSLPGSIEVKSHVVNITSVGGVQGSIKFSGLSAYSSSKGALITLTECLAEELKADGIYVNCIALGSVETEMFQSAFPGIQASSKPEEIGKWIASFGSDGYRYFNGKILQVSTRNP